MLCVPQCGSDEAHRQVARLGHLREIGQHIAKQDPDAVDRFFTATKEAFDLLTRHPGRRAA